MTQPGASAGVSDAIAGDNIEMSPGSVLEL